MMHPHLKARRGFTLIELLVVIAIIALLMGLVFPALNSGMRQAKKSKAEAEAKNIEAAIHLFKRDYGYFPVPRNQQAIDDDEGYETEDESMLILKVLMGIPEDYNLNHQLNPRKEGYLDMDTLGEDGTLEDPWGTQYIIKLDRNYDGKVYYPTASEVYRTEIIVYSAGPDRDITTADDNLANVEL